MATAFVSFRGGTPSRLCSQGAGSGEGPSLSEGSARLLPASGLLFITAVPITKLFAWGEGDSGGHVLRETTSRGLCGLVCPSRTSERSLGLDVDNPASAWDVQIVLRVHVR